jgi:hypothetical protein
MGNINIQLKCYGDNGDRNGQNERGDSKEKNGPAITGVQPRKPKADEYTWMKLYSSSIEPACQRFESDLRSLGMVEFEELKIKQLLHKHCNMFLQSKIHRVGEIYSLFAQGDDYSKQENTSLIVDWLTVLRAQLPKFWSGVFAILIEKYKSNSDFLLELRDHLVLDTVSRIEALLNDVSFHSLSVGIYLLMDEDKSGTVTSDEFSRHFLRTAGDVLRRHLLLDHRLGKLL